MNLNGKKLGMLLVIGDDPNRKGYAICQCDCGKTKSIRKTSLTKTYKPTRSCGCIQARKASHTGSTTILKNNELHLLRNIKYNTNIQSISKTDLFKNNTSGVTGVCWNTGHKSWQAYIHIHGKKIHLGYFKDKNKAIEARKNAEDIYFKPILDEVKGETND